MADCQSWNVALTATGFVVAIFFAWLLLRERKQAMASTAEVKQIGRAHV
jgi:hypothetical protein